MNLEASNHANSKFSRMEQADVSDMFNSIIKKMLKKLLKNSTDQLKEEAKLRSKFTLKRMTEKEPEKNNSQTFSSATFQQIILLKI